MRVAVWQFDVARGDVAANLACVRRGLEQAAEAGVELLLLPEMWPTSFLSGWGREDPLEALRPAIEASVEAVVQAGRRAAELGLALAGSAFAPDPSGGLPRNRFSLWYDGAPRLAYDKVHLFTATAEHLAFSAGDQPPSTWELPMRAGGAIRLSGLICYDLRFAPVVEAARSEGAELLLVPAQWPSPRTSHFEALLCGRAVETQAWVLGANRTGVENFAPRRAPLRFPGNSRLIAPDGVVRAAGGQDVGEELVVGELDVELSRELRRGVRVFEDRREELYARWRSDS
jgi:omega-amidase